MDRNAIEQAIYRRTNKNTASPETATQTRIRHFINQRHRRLLAMPGMSHLRDGVQTFASVILNPIDLPQSRYALPNVASVQRMWETTTDRRLWPMTLDTYRSVAPDPSTSGGTPTHYVFQGYEPVAQQPFAPAQLKVKSTTADTGTVYIEGDITGGYPRSESLTLNGTTYVNTSSAAWIRVRKLYMSAAAAGVVTLANDLGAAPVAELASIAIGQTRQKYWVFYLHPQPSAVITYSVDYTIQNTDLAQATDEPLIPEDFHALLELGATMDELTKTDDPRYVVAKSEYEDLIKDLKYWIAKQSGGQYTAGERSRLGASFPAWTG